MPEHSTHETKPLCPSCGSSETRWESMHFHHRDESSRVALCQACETAFLAPQPSADWLTHEYSGYYIRRSSGDQKRENFRQFFRTHPPTAFGQILEIGGGEGACARAILEFNPSAQLTVVEAHADAEKFYSDIKCRLVSVSLEEWLATNREKFDLIMLFDVLEHLRDPSAALKALAERLQPGGEIWLSAPFYDSTSRRLLGRFWPQYKPEHLFYFSETGLRDRLMEIGFEKIDITTHTKHLPISYLLSVGAGFGPRVLQDLFGFLRTLIPKFVQNRTLSFHLGERLVQAAIPQGQRGS